MPLGARRVGVALALMSTMVFTAPASADEYCQDTAHPVASVLVIHGGGWYGGSAAYGRGVCSPLAAMGYRVRLLEYPLRTVPGSIQYARDAAEEEARRGRPVYAMGVSAGGSIAEYLAVKPYIDGAVAVAPLSDFVNWRPPSAGFWDGLGMTPSMRYHYSPYNNFDAPAPLRIIHSHDDQLVPYEQSVRMASRCGQACELVTLKLGLGHASLGARGPALQWFAQRVSDPSYATSAPVLSRASVRPRSFAVDPAFALRATGRRSPKRGARFDYTLSKRSRVTLTIRRRPAAVQRRRCRGKPRSSDRVARPTPRRRVQTITVQGTTGKNSSHFPGIVGSRALRPGCYTATLLATNPSGRHSQPQVLRFKVLK